MNHKASLVFLVIVVAALLLGVTGALALVSVRNPRELLDYLADQFTETRASPAREKGLR